MMMFHCHFRIDDSKLFKISYLLPDELPISSPFIYFVHLVGAAAVGLRIWNTSPLCSVFYVISSYWISDARLPVWVSQAAATRCSGGHSHCRW